MIWYNCPEILVDHGYRATADDVVYICPEDVALDCIQRGNGRGVGTLQCLQVSFHNCLRLMNAIFMSK